MNRTRKLTYRAAFASGLAGAWMMLAGGTPVADSPTVSAPPIVLAQAGDGPKVSYTIEQAQNGRDRYQRDCQECHGDDLRGGLNGGAPLAGMAFEEKYFGGAPASWLFEYMSTAMPPNAPGRYSDQVYVELMAYILQRNGVQRGAPLPASLDALDNIAMEK
jgi:mono/diheme cytochrome c family protein